VVVEHLWDGGEARREGGGVPGSAQASGGVMHRQGGLGGKWRVHAASTRFRFFGWWRLWPAPSYMGRSQSTYIPFPWFSKFVPGPLRMSSWSTNI
jgi:hypothetical protein